MTPKRHLRRAAHPVAEDDRDLSDAIAGEDRLVRHLDLEPVAARVDRAAEQVLERLRSRNALKPPVRSCTGTPEHDARVEAAALADRPAQERPADDAAAADVARAERDVGLVERRDQRRGSPQGRARSRSPSARPRRRRRRERGGTRPDTRRPRPSFARAAEQQRPAARRSRAPRRSRPSRRATNRRSRGCGRRCRSRRRRRAPRREVAPTFSASSNVGRHTTTRVIRATP